MKRIVSFMLLHEIAHSQKSFIYFETRVESNITVILKSEELDLPVDLL